LARCEKELARKRAARGEIAVDFEFLRSRSGTAMESLQTSESPKKIKGDFNRVQIGTSSKTENASLFSPKAALIYGFPDQPREPVAKRKARLKPGFSE
jgi:hypothetical protein